MIKNARGVGVLQVVGTIACLVVIVAGLMFIAGRLHGRDFKFSTPYQAVLLTNGSVYFGKIHGWGGPHPVMTEVYYIVSHTDPQTHQVSNVLIKRGKELHEPDRMYLNVRQIIFIEPVGIHSKVAQLIAQNGQ